jgi:tetratricopeptide (TPR) repeat protein
VERTLKSWRKSEPLNPDLMFLESQHLLLKRQYSEAETLVRQALAIQGSEPLNLLLVQALYLQGKYASALEGSEALFLQQPWHWEIVHLHARILARVGRMESAKKLGERFIFRQDSQGQAHLLLGDLHREQNDPARAIKHYQTGLERYPEHTALLDALSSAHAEAGQWTELRDLLEIRVRRDAVQDSALVLRLLERLILAYRNLGENERARETWVRYQELNTGRNGQQPLLLPDPFILPSRIRSRLGAELSG